MTRQLLTVAATFAITAAASSAPAAEISIIPRYTGYYSADFGSFTSAPLSFWDTFPSRNPNIHHVFEFDMTLTGLAPNQSFAFARFDITLGPGLLRDAAAPGYEGDNRSWSTGSGAGRSGIFYTNNSDQGAQDLKDIFHSSDVKTGAQMNPAEAAPETLGRIYLSVQPGFSGFSEITVSPIAGDSWGTWNNLVTGGLPAYNSTGTQIAHSTGFAPVTLEFPDWLIPGDTDNDDDVDGADFVVWSNHVGQPSSPPYFNVGDFDYDGDVDGKDFIIQSWYFYPSSAAPAALGTTIPEPTALPLIGLAAAGSQLRRRRSLR